MVYSASQDGGKFLDNKNRKFVSVITRVVKILEKFTNNYKKRLNFTKLTHYLNLESSEVDEIITLILTFQELFTGTFNTYIMKKKITKDYC